MEEILSQYIGDFQPEAQTNGSSGFRIIALICNNDFATCLAVSTSKIMALMYEVFINHHSLIISNSVAQDNYKQYEYDEAFVWTDFLNNISDEKPSKLWVFCNDIN